MARLQDQPITKADIEEYIRSADDFALELFVYREALAKGLEASHGGTYEDPITKKIRQFDVRARARVADCEIALALECKNLRPSSPLLVSRISRSEVESFHDVLLSWEPPSRGIAAMDIFNRSKVIKISGAASRYKPADPVGKSTAQVGRTVAGDLVAADDQVYEKWSQAFASAADLVSEARYANKKKNGDDFFTVVLPILVVSDDSLWVVDYADDGTPGDPVRTTAATVYIGREYSDTMGATYTASHLEICTRSRVPMLFDELGKPGPLWQATFPKHLISAEVERLTNEG